ncbi:MAG: AAA family ATPase [Helicobacteraceae bacterium]|jgi:ATP-dependent exoDNAse (exonuclease V) alpha subunit|nr:AAA family ATPase [Helicobacteraceae bacterium]
MLKKAIDLAVRENLFITGGAGVGKSFLLVQMCRFFSENNRKTALLASTGIAAVGIGGMTLHRFFLFGVCKNLEELSRHDGKKYVKQELPKRLELIRELDLIAIDEISMVSADLMEMIESRLIRSGFAGKIALCGDFYQLPPVRERVLKREARLFDNGFYAFESGFWERLRLKTLTLFEPKRADDPAFAVFLNNLRRGEIGGEDERLLRIYASQREVLKIDPTHLFATNAEADALNARRLGEIDAKEHTIRAEVEVSKEADAAIAENFIKTLTTPLILTVKIGARVLFTVNEGELFYNGERGIVEAVEKDGIAVVKDNGEYVMVTPHIFKLEDAGERTLVRITQFPLRLAWAITIHKSQGMSIAPLVVNTDRLFEAGQLYVALSRSSNPTMLYIQSSKDPIAAAKRSIKPNETVARFYESIERASQTNVLPTL